MLRFLIAIIFVVLYLIISLPIMLVLWIVRFFTPKATYAMQRIVQWAFSVVWHIAGVKLEVRGEDRLPADGAVLFVGNHRSFFDVIIGYSLLKRRTIIVSKDSFKKVPLLNLNMMFIGVRFIDRKNLRKGVETIKECGEVAKTGISVLVFPEGTRNRGDALKLLPMHDGSFMIAQRSGCPVVPMAFTGTAEIFEKHSPWLKAGKVIVEFGEPQTIAELPKEYKKHPGNYFAEKITGMLEEHVKG